MLSIGNRPAGHSIVGGGLEPVRVLAQTIDALQDEVCRRSKSVTH